MPDLVSPILLYGACALGALGVGLALPRRGTSPQVLGGLIAAIGLGGIFLALGLASPGALPNVNFYIFSAIALGASLRVISHPRPVYAALYFVLTILSSCGLYVILSAEFLAFALVIVYAGAILITYLFVIMLATEAPTAEEPEALLDYDRYSREPLAATVTAFVLLATLTTILGTGVHGLNLRGGALLTAPGALDAGGAPAGVAQSDRRLLASLPKRVETALRAAHDPADPRQPLMRDGEEIARDAKSRPMIDTRERTVLLIHPTGTAGDGPTRTVPLPADLDVTNTEGVAFTLLGEHPGSIEIAGVILLMAMLGAVVLARKKVEMDESAAQDRHLAPAAPGGLGA